MLSKVSFMKSGVTRDASISIYGQPIGLRQASRNLRCTDRD